MSAQSIICPIHGTGDNIQRISGVVASGQASGTFSGPTGGVVNVNGKWGTSGGYTTLSGSTVTNLAALLTPPPAPRTWPYSGLTTFLIWYFCILPFIAAPVGMIIAWWGSYDRQTGWLPLILVGGAICLGIGAIIIRWFIGKVRRVRAAYPTEKQAWDKAMVRWGRSYYCFRDDIVFDPDTRETCQPPNVKQFLYAGS